MKHLLPIVLIAAGCGSGTGQPGTSQRALDEAGECAAAEFDHCMDVLGLDEAECDERAGSACTSGCFAEKFDYCVDVMGLDEGDCEAKADAWCAETDCVAAKFDHCVDVMGLDEGTCKSKAAEWCE